VDGWAKDADANTAYGQTVEPLPFHAMSQYPYKDGERFPDDAAHRQYRAIYNTRPALRLIRPLALPDGRGSVTSGPVTSRDTLATPEPRPSGSGFAPGR
jgi:hypothetical protein